MYQCFDGQFYLLWILIHLEERVFLGMAYTRILETFIIFASFNKEIIKYRPMIEFQTYDVSMPELDFALLREWIERVCSAHDRVAGDINYQFCSDEHILEVNRQFLNHDYYTDIITFDYSRGRHVSGDMVISLETVASNAEEVGEEYGRELHRVIIHGVLHLCGIDDKGPGEREIMERHEDEALDMLESLRV